MLPRPGVQSGCARRSRPGPRAPRFPLRGRRFVLGAELWACGLELAQGLPAAPWPRLHPVPGPGSMASRGRKRKAEAAAGSAAEKQEKLADGQKEVEEATVVIEHW